MLSDKPSKPGRPAVADYDEKSVDLEWSAPASDGGARITHYIIQKKLLLGTTAASESRWENCAWHEMSATEETALTCKVVDLKEKQKWQFRVVAVNKAGESPPSEPSEPHLVKFRKRM